MKLINFFDILIRIRDSFKLEKFVKIDIKIYISQLLFSFS